MNLVCTSCGFPAPYKGHARCKNCYAKDQQEQRRKHIVKRHEYDKKRRPTGIKRPRPNPLGDRDYWLKKRFGISLEEYNNLLDSQSSLCAICLKPETKSRDGVIMSLAVDHCHKTKTIRGLLCNSCNLGLGKFFDDPNALQTAVSYLRRSNH